MNKEKGIWISMEILEDSELDLSAKVVLALYKYYTIEGELHCCMLTNEQIAVMIGISVPTVQRAKRKLKELDLIETNNGIKVWYKGYQNDTHNNAAQGYQNDTLPYQNDTPRGIKMTPLGYQNDTHKKERKKNKKRNNKKEYNISTSDISDTSDISTYIGELELVNPTLYTLLMADDDIEVLNYIKENYTNENIEYVRSWWSNDSNKLQTFERFLQNF